MSIHDDYIDKVICGDNREVMAQMPDGVFQAVCTSPPYWSLRDYGLEPTVWDGDPLCEHVWGNKQPCYKPTQVPQTKWANNEAISNGQHATKGQFCQLCGAFFGTLGLEPDPDLYVKHIVDIFREVRRVLRDDGTCWLNIADSYFGGGNNRGNKSPISAKQASNKGATGQCADAAKNIGKHPTLKPKDLVGIPERLFLALQADGWWIRVRIPWIKLNGMPSSQRDRPTVSHEYIFLMSKAQRYYYDQEGVKLPHSRDWTNSGGTLTNAPRYASNPLIKGAAGEHRGSGPAQPSPSGRIRRTTDWWFDSLSDLFSDEFLAFVLPTEPFTMEMCQKCKQVYNRKEYRKLEVLIIPAEESETGKEQKKRICAGCGSTEHWLSHFATFGEKLVTPMILAGSPVQACPHCGAGWKRVVEKESKLTRPGTASKYRTDGCESCLPREKARLLYRPVAITQTIGWQPTCSCENNDGSGHPIVLDPFAGSGTTCAVAKKHGRAYVGIEQNPDYCILAERRIEETEVEIEDCKQLDMFAEAAGD